MGFAFKKSRFVINRRIRFNADAKLNEIVLIQNIRRQMTPSSVKIFVLCLILGLTIANNVTSPSNVTFAPPPPINVTLGMVLNSSQVDGRLIGSKRIQALELFPNNTGNGSTNFRLSAFDRNAPNNTAVFNLTLPGNWTYVLGTRDTLSCSVIRDNNTNAYGLLLFQAENRLFRTIAQDFLRSVPAAQNSTPEDIRSSLKVLQNCDGLYINGTLYRLIPGSNNLTVVTVPAGWGPRSTSESLRYGIASSNLYRFDPNATTPFTSIRVLPPSQNYEIRTWQGRIVVAAANVTNGTDGTNMTVINQNIFVFNDVPGGNLSFVGQFNVTAGLQMPLPIIPFMTSPQLTKIGIAIPGRDGGNGTNMTNFSAPVNASAPPKVILVLKNVDYAASMIGNLTFKDPERFRRSVRNLAANNTDFYFGDNYYVLRNATAGNVTGLENTSFVESAYQFVGGQVVFLRDRILNQSRESNDFRRIWVDTAITNQLVVLNGFQTGSGLQIDQFAYGSLASINKVIIPASPPFITLPVPPHTSRFVPRHGLAWVFLNSDNTTTNFTIFSADPNAPNNTARQNGNIRGNARVLAMSDHCLILVDTISQNVTVVASPLPPQNGTNTTNNTAPNNNTNASLAYENVTPLLATITITNTSRWAISDRCDRFAVDGKIFFRTPNQTRFSPIANNASTFMPSSIDAQLGAAVVNNSIWLFSPNTSSFVRAFDNPQPILPESTIRVVNNNQVVVSAVNGTAAQVLAFFIEPSGNFTNCLNFFFPNYQAAPKIQVSPRLTKILIMGPFTPPNASQPQPKYDAFTINFNNRTFQNISFDLKSLPDPVGAFIALNEKYLYIRSLQMPNNSNITNGTAPPTPKQSIFFINQDITPQLAKSSELSQQQINSWTRTFVHGAGNDSVNIFIESSAGNATNPIIIVNLLQVSARQAQLNSGGNVPAGITGTLVNGQIRLCSPGCNDCSSGSCTGCSNGYAFDASASSCIKCGQNCRACSATSTSNCTECIMGSYLSGSSCLPCDRNCVSCAGTASNCTSCPPGQAFVNGSCGGCPRNCITCDTTNSSRCLACNRGFVAVNGNCRGCGISCSNCSASNITQCLSCAPGLNLINSACVPCPEKCQACNNGICTNCIPGYTPNAAGVCVTSCQLSCATCMDNQPSACLSCYQGANLLNGACQLDLSCNTDSSCTHCGQGLGYVLVGSNCVQCNSISNCLQCDSNNAQQCAICQNGYFVNSSSLCSACFINCLQCLSADLCSACAVGYTLPEGQSQGQCLQCQPPCATCLGVPTYCTTCIDGFTKRGWKCQNNTYVKFTFTLNGGPEVILNDIDNIVQIILRICGQNSTNVAAVTFNSIQNGSTIIDGSLTSSSSPVTATSALSGSLATGATFGNYSVVSASVSTQGVPHDNPPPKTGLIVGLAVGLTVAVIIVIVVIVCVVQRKKMAQTNALNDREGDVVVELSNQESNMGQKLNDRSPTRNVPNLQYGFSQQQNSDIKVWEKEMIDL